MEWQKIQRFVIDTTKVPVRINMFMVPRETLDVMRLQKITKKKDFGENSFILRLLEREL